MARYPISLDRNRDRAPAASQSMVGASESNGKAERYALARIISVKAQVLRLTLGTRRYLAIPVWTGRAEVLRPTD